MTSYCTWGTTPSAPFIVWHWRRLPKNIWGVKPKYWDGKKVVITDKCMGVSQLLVVSAGLSAQVYAYAVWLYQCYNSLIVYSGRSHTEQTRKLVTPPGIHIWTLFAHISLHKWVSLSTIGDTFCGCSWLQSILILTTPRIWHIALE